MLDNTFAFSGALGLFFLSFVAAVLAATVTTNDTRRGSRGLVGWLIFVVGLLVAWALLIYLDPLPRGAASWWWLLAGMIVVVVTAAPLKPGIRNDYARFFAWLAFSSGILLILYVVPDINGEFINWLSSW